MVEDSKNHSKPEEDRFLELLIGIFRRSGGRVARKRKLGGERPDLVMEYGGKKYLIELKRSSEGRRDRLLPLLSQAALQVQAVAKNSPQPLVPMAVVAAPHISDSIADEIKAFAQKYIPDISIGIFDSEGLYAFIGDGLEALNSKRQFSRGSRPSFPSGSIDLFSDLNQWMLKILLSARIPDSMLSAPPGEYRNASQLAEAAGVSVMSAYRLVRQLSKDSFLDESDGFFRIVRVEELMQRWLSYSLRAAKEVPARWIIRAGEDQLHAAVKSYLEGMAQPSKSRVEGKRSRSLKRSRLCLGLFSAADALGVGFVHGAPPYLYVESLELGILRQLGLSLENAAHKPDVYLRIPDNPEAVFRAAVPRLGLAISDVLQVWLDVSRHPARGKDQADHIRRRALSQLFEPETS
jgi:hypothetical protein